MAWKINCRLGNVYRCWKYSFIHPSIINCPGQDQWVPVPRKGPCKHTFAHSSAIRGQFTCLFWEIGRKPERTWWTPRQTVWNVLSSALNYWLCTWVCYVGLFLSNIHHAFILIHTSNLIVIYSGKYNLYSNVLKLMVTLQSCLQVQLGKI